MDSDLDRMKKLDLLSALGAAVLGAGLALLFTDRLERFAVPALFIGIAAHGWAMFAKRRLERRAGMPLPKWAQVAEWSCWILLAGLGLYAGHALFR